MKQLTEATETGEIDPQKPARYYLDHLNAHREQYGL
jgi:hypothetical protein